MASQYSPNQLESMIMGDSVLNKKYRVLHRLGQGCFGAVYKVINIQQNMQRALKVEVYKKGKLFHPALYNQFLILAQFKNNIPGVSKAYCYGQWKHGAFLQIDIYQQDIFNVVHYKNKIQGYQLNQLTLSMLKTLKGIHKYGIIHRDLKPQNIMRKKIRPIIQNKNKEQSNKENLNQEGNYNIIKNKYQYFLIDFGISYAIDLQKDSHNKIVRGFIGTPRYASIAAHKSQSQGKKDDLQALFYVLAFCFYKRLPWFRLHVQEKQKLMAIMKKKANSSYQLFKGMGSQYLIAYEYIRDLKKQAEPNYQYLITLFKRIKSLTMSQENPLLPLRLNSIQKKLSFPTEKKNLLMIPTLNIIDDDQNKNGSNKSIMNLSAYSQKVQCQLVSKIFQQNQFKQIKQFKLTKHSQENIQDAQSQEPIIKDIGKYSNILYLNQKNPFILNQQNSLKDKAPQNTSSIVNNVGNMNKNKLSQNKFTIYIKRQSKKEEENKHS